MGIGDTRCESEPTHSPARLASTFGFLRGLMSTNYFSAPTVALVLGVAYCVATGVSFYDIAHGGRITNPPRRPASAFQEVSGVPATGTSGLEDISLRK